MKRSTAFFLAIVTLLILIGLYKAAEKIGPGGNNFAASAQQAVEAQGYTNVQYTGVDSVACGETAGFAFDADNVNHVRVHLVACSADGLVNYAKGWQIVTR